MLHRRLKYHVFYFVPVAVQAISAFDDPRLNPAATMDELRKSFFPVDWRDSLELIEQRKLGAAPGNRHLSYGYSITECRNAGVQAGGDNQLRPADNFAD